MPFLSPRGGRTILDYTGEKTPTPCYMEGI